ncbi:hypothetical protein PHLGIDRAFT_140255 [Phlebiopsis gigantea 11061_1 CR5-6]|uniref:F-box domain-containing protein n=1 Tax=Phlebiopsis gigantea (strain 11061_1 CR5-6) TaxID=745531 RepID=A0A0C3S5H8_PHLG1|nr:hypothetical protein PHLGIDRAFT_140255 [Phlebiopsis gigantea 11061_1 CR5-6]
MSGTSALDRLVKKQRIDRGGRIYADAAFDTYATLKDFGRDLSASAPSPTTTHGLPKLPRDILFIILSKLQEDKHALQMCMFVCRTWLNECRSHLFRITHVSDALYPNRGLRNRSNRVQSFVDFLKGAASPGFCSSIRVLRLSGDQKMSEAHQRTRINITMLASVLESLPRLRVLDLWRIVLARETGPSRLRTHKFTLDALSMHQMSCSIDEAAGLFDVLGLFSYISTIDASYVDVPALTRPVVSGDTTGISSSFQVNDVRLKGCLRGQDRPEVRRLSTVGRMLEMLHDLPGTPNLRSLTVQCGVMGEVKVLGQFLTQVGKSIEFLAIELFELTREHIDPETVVQTLHLDECTQLKSLRLVIFPNTSEGSRNSAASVCFSLLIGTLSPKIRRLDVILGYNDMENLSTFKWEALQEAPWRRLKNLEAITFELMPHRSDSSIEMNARQFISNQLPTLRARDILKFDTKSFWY